jgi:hypothetical protein
VKWPRTYAQEIASETSREKRLLMLEKVPKHLRSLVRKHVEIAYDRKKLGTKRSERHTRSDR